MKKHQKLLLTLLMPLLLLAASVKSAAALDVTASPEFSSNERIINGASGFDYLANGDIVSIVADQSSGVDTVATIYLSEANGDFSPAGAKPLATITLPAFAYPSFLAVAPTNDYLIFGVSGFSGVAGGTDSLYKMYLSNNVIEKVVDIGGAYDFIFDSNYSGYVSYNEGGFGDTTNKIARVVLTPSGADVTPFAAITNTFSGPLTIDPFGYLHYVKTGFIAADKRLLRFSSTQIANALSSSVLLTEADSEVSIPVKVSSDIIFSPYTTPNGELILSDFATGELQHLSQATGYQPAPFLLLSDSGNAVAPTVLSAFKGTGSFKAGASPQPKIGVSAAKNGFTSFTVLELTLKPTTIKPSILSAKKNTVQIVLPAVQDTGVVYSLNLMRQYVSSGGKIKVEKVKTKDQSSNTFVVNKLKRGTYFYTYQTKKTVDGQVQTSLPSAVVSFTL